MVIGAGIVGASCAYYLAECGATVHILERGAPAGGATGRSAAGIRHQFSHRVNVEMSLYSARVFSGFEAQLGVDAGYRKVGYLYLISQGWSAWQAQVEVQRALGARVEVLDPETLEARFPDLNIEGLAGASLGLDDGVVDPHALTMGYLGGAKGYGATLHLGTEVTGLSFGGGQWRVQTKAQTQSETQSETFYADAVINAAGAYAGEIGKLAHLEVPVLPYRRNVYATGPLADYPHPSPLMIDQQTGVWLRSEGTRFIMGLANKDETPGDNQAVDWGWLEDLLTRALPRFPFLERAGLDRKACWAGLYAMTPDHLPILGEARSHPGFFNACGFSGHGVQHSPATGHSLAAEVLGRAPGFDLSDFRLERFETADAARGAVGEVNVV